MRLFNTYGPRMKPDDGRVVSNFVSQALAHADLTIYGDGSQTRSFCYVSDIIDALVAMMATNEDVTGPINLGSQDEISVSELANRVIQLTGGDAKVRYEGLPQDDPTQRQPDIALAMQELDWKPTVPLQEGLRTTVDWFQKLGNG